jgi:hypothetical protein
MADVLVLTPERCFASKQNREAVPDIFLFIKIEVLLWCRQNFSDGEVRGEGESIARANICDQHLSLKND